MSKAWKANIAGNLSCVQRDAGPEIVVVVSGSETDRAYWKTFWHRPN